MSLPHRTPSVVRGATVMSHTCRFLKSDGYYVSMWSCERLSGPKYVHMTKADVARACRKGKCWVYEAGEARGSAERVMELEQAYEDADD